MNKPNQILFCILFIVSCADGNTPMGKCDSDVTNIYQVGHCDVTKESLKQFCGKCTLFVNYCNMTGYHPAKIVDDKFCGVKK